MPNAFVLVRWIGASEQYRHHSYSLVFICYLAETCDTASRSSDTFSVSRSGKSSGELGSVMILNPMVGKRFDKRVNQGTSQ
jgi:hypothetical protein